MDSSDPSALLTGTPYRAYAYAYPHKTAYRPLAQPAPLEQVWSGEPRGALFLYIHIPFCEMRCGFCNLFTVANPKGGIEAAYLDALERQARRTAAALGGATFVRLAIGGGTPTYLEAADLHRLFDITANCFGLDPRAVPVSVETSPKTATPERLRALRARGADRISIGVQSFDDAEAAAAGRPQRRADVERALEQIRAEGFPTLNIDLIYGIPGQTVDSWLKSLRAALRYAPEELYLYPLYVRPLTGLGRRAPGGTDPEWDAQRLACYRAGRDMLRAAGYTQTSMRMFRAAHAPAAAGPVYCCQDDGMVGLGCGARSYTRALHYSSEYAVSAGGVRAIIADYLARPDESFGAAHYGIALGPEEQRRRFVIQSLLQVEGLDLPAYRRRFGGEVLDDLPALAELPGLGLAERAGDVLRLTNAGLERSDAIGPWLYTTEVGTLMEAYELR
ncbi:MAG TPA: STM4012 family radical SAM protein [Roseiflexaceae bacterium]|nr:STM4012 family radical SAM protein [Roseiflexaceae bacterium]